MARRTTDFQTIRSEGGLLPPDLLRRVLDPKQSLEGTQPEDYSLSQGERLNEVITQSWSRLRKYWTEFRAAAANLPQGEAGTGLTNDKWSLPLLRELGFGLLPTSAGHDIGGRTYAISRFFGPVPVHLVGSGLSLDRRAAGVRGAAAANPHGLVQEFLNRSPGHLWAIVSNGASLRILRDSQALSRQSFLEFDLEAMFSGEVYSDFVVLWLVAHATRFAPREADHPETCWLEQWTRLAAEQGTRALGDLRIGVERALQILGEGFTGHPKNAALRDALRTGRASPADFHGQLLRVVYRLIFLFVAEDRTIDGYSLLHQRDDSEAARLARERHATHYSTTRLRELASNIKGSRHGDLWRQFQLLVPALSGDARFAAIREHLALPALGSFLWDAGATTTLNDAELTNHDFLEAMRYLAFARQGKVLRPVDYKNLGAEELGGVYESLLALTPQISADGAGFAFAEFAGNERKTSGSYYTPDSLVQCLLDSALDPVVEEAVKGKTGTEAENAILALKVCDPAVGSGHFLVGAAHRLARHLARVRALAQGESEPSPLLYQHALRDVIGHCLYGVDLNPMAAELCRVSLWLEALEPGKPLTFLDHHIRVGNSLVGTTPELIAAGLPDDAFNPIEGDDKKVCAALKRRNKQERAGQLDMVALMVAEPKAEYDSIEARTRSIEEAHDYTMDEVRRKADEFQRLVVSPEYRHAQQVADAWCAAFVWKKQANAPSEPVTTETIRRLEADANALTPLQCHEVERLSRQYRFFHWHLAFPEVFAKGGFDCVLGNPPWERVKIQEKEWFAERSPEIANAPNAAARKQLIGALKAGDPALYTQFVDDSRKAEGESHLVRNSGRYPLCGRGDINVYTVFAEGMRSLLNDRGRVGCVLPTGIATDDTTKFFFQDVVEKKSLISLFDFENKGIFFPGVHSSYKFCLFTAGRGLGRTAEAAEFVFFAHAVEDLRDPQRRFTLSAEEIALMNPNTRTCPIFRSKADAELLKGIQSRVPTLYSQKGSTDWCLEVFQKMIDVTIHARLCSFTAERPSPDWLPVYIGRMLRHYNHRATTYAGVSDADRESGNARELTPRELDDPFVSIHPSFWVHRDTFVERLGGRYAGAKWLLSARYVTNTTNERTVIAGIRPFLPSNNMLPTLLVQGTSTIRACFVSNISSFAFDYVARQKVGGTTLAGYIFEQLPTLSSSTYLRSCRWSMDSRLLREWILSRVLELTYTAWDLEPFAQDCGWSGPPFRWDEERRFLLRCELDAAFLHLYLPADPNGDWRPARRADGCPYEETPEQLADLKRHFPTPRDAVAYIMNTFPIVRRKDEEKYNGDYRTKRVILDIYDGMAEAIRTGKPYQTHLDPPPADPRCCHPPRAGQP
ncbi:MAG: N-6 DNA methylase [Candidatus Eisenbacteria bacterium]